MTGRETVEEKIGKWREYIRKRERASGPCDPESLDSANGLANLFFTQIPNCAHFNTRPYKFSF